MLKLMLISRWFRKNLVSSDTIYLWLFVLSSSIATETPLAWLGRFFLSSCRLHLMPRKINNRKKVRTSNCNNELQSIWNFIGPAFTERKQNKRNIFNVPSCDSLKNLPKTILLISPLSSIQRRWWFNEIYRSH